MLNRADSRVGITHEDVSAIIGRDPDVLIPSDREIPRSVNEGTPIVAAKQRSDAARAFRSSPTGTRRRRLRSPAPLPTEPPAPDAAREEAVDGTARAPQHASKPAAGRRRDPFAELKSRIHFTVIGDLGPQLYNVNMDPEDLRERVLADVRDQLAQETGSRATTGSGSRSRSPTTSSATARSSGCSPTTP